MAGAMRALLAEIVITGIGFAGLASVRALWYRATTKRAQAGIFRGP